MKTSLALALLALSLAGCASDTQDARTVEKMAVDGQCAPAALYADQNITDVGLRIYEHAYVADHCLKDGAAMLSYLNLSARYGNATAQRVLAKIGKPVPTADLAPPPPQSQSSGDGAALLLLGALSGYNSGQSGPMPMVNVGGHTTMCSGASGMMQCY